MSKYNVRVLSFLYDINKLDSDIAGYPHYFTVEAKSKKEAEEKMRKKMVKRYGENYFKITDVELYDKDFASYD